MNMKRLDSTGERSITPTELIGMGHVIHVEFQKARRMEEESIPDNSPRMLGMVLLVVVGVVGGLVWWWAW